MCVLSPLPFMWFHFKPSVSTHIFFSFEKYNLTYIEFQVHNEGEQKYNFFFHFKIDLLGLQKQRLSSKPFGQQICTCVRTEKERMVSEEWRCSTVAALIPTNTADSLCGPKKNLKSHHTFVRVHIVNNHHSITGRFVWCLKLHTLLLLSYCGRVAAVSNRHHSWCYFLISKWYNQKNL